LDSPESRTGVLDYDAGPVLDGIDLYGHSADWPGCARGIAQQVGDHAPHDDLFDRSEDCGGRPQDIELTLIDRTLCGRGVIDNSNEVGQCAPSDGLAESQPLVDHVPEPFGLLDDLMQSQARDRG
jgi:hypothetical protein